MPAPGTGAGYNDVYLDLIAQLATDRTFQVRLHTGDPGDEGTASPVAAENGYEHQVIPKDSAGSVTKEATGRYSNSADVDFGAASSADDNTGWGTINWITVWYDANDPANTVAGNFDTLAGKFQLATAQQVNTNDPFVIRQRTIDFVAQNP